MSNEQQARELLESYATAVISSYRATNEKTRMNAERQLQRERKLAERIVAMIAMSKAKAIGGGR